MSLDQRFSLRANFGDGSDRRVFKRNIGRRRRQRKNKPTILECDAVFAPAFFGALKLSDRQGVKKLICDQQQKTRWQIRKPPDPARLRQIIFLNLLKPRALLNEMNA